MRWLMIGLLVLGIAGCKKSTEVQLFEVKYEITRGPVEMDSNIQYLDQEGHLIQKTVSLPWGYSFSGAEGDSVYLAAENLDGTTLIFVKIYRGTWVLSEAECGQLNCIAVAAGKL